MNREESKRVGLLDRVLQIAFDPLLFFTVALFAGEASIPTVGLSSSLMYAFSFVGILLMVGKRSRKANIKYLSSVLLIYAYVLFRNLSGDPNKLLNYELPNLVTAVIIAIINLKYCHEEDIAKIEAYIFMMMCTLALLGVLRFAAEPSSRLAVFGGPNGYYKIVLLFEAQCFYRYLRRDNPLYGLGMILGIFLCMATGSRGGIVTMLLLLCFEALVLVARIEGLANVRIDRLFSVVVLVILGYFSIRFLAGYSQSFSALLERASGILSSENIGSQTSVQARSYLSELSIRLFRESPLIGWGGGYVFDYTNGLYPYSHNLILEFLCEQGLLGTAPLIIFLLGVPIRALRPSMRDEMTCLLFSAFTVYFIGSMFSGNILDSKTVFLFGVLINNHYINRTRATSQKEG